MAPRDLISLPVRAAFACELLRRGEQELARLRVVRGAYKRTARRIARASVQVALAASLLGVPLAGSSWADGDPCFAGGVRLDDRLVPAPELVDIDGDGDLDAFIGEGFHGNTVFFPNTGTAAAPAFGAPQTNPFGLFDIGDGASPELVDIDGDGDLDAFIGESGGNTFFLRNTGTAAAPAFAAAQTNPFGLVDVGGAASPELVDIDGDGDLDALIGNGGGNTFFLRNTGTAAAPAFAGAQVNPFGLSDVGYGATPELVDIDGDGDLDVFVGESGGNTLFFGNSGTAAGPAFAAALPNPFGLFDVGSSAAPELVDFDADGDLDALIGPSFGSWTFFRNVGTAAAPAFATPQTNPFGLLAVDRTASPEMVDINGDGDLDAFIGDRGGNTLFFRNAGTKFAPLFFMPQTNPFGLGDIGYEAEPELVDIDGDGDLDALVGEKFGHTIFFRNSGTAAAPAFAAGVADPFGLVDVGYYAAPELADIDGDGDLDAFVGDNFGNTVFQRNTGTTAAPAFGTAQLNPFGLVKVPIEVKVELVDSDGDGDLDAFLGHFGGNTVFLRNTGTAAAPAFAPPQINPFGLADVGSFSTPEVVDIDGDGDLDAFVGEKYGSTIFFRNDCRPRADVAIDFGSVHGVWIWRNVTAWVKLHGVSPESMVAADVDRTGVDELVVDFGPGHGVWVWRNGVSWEQLLGLSPEDMVSADLDGNGKEEMLLDLGASHGVWVSRNDSSMQILHGVSPQDMVSADLDGNGKDEVVLDFGASGVWVRRNDASWEQLHGVSPEAMVSARLDGNGKEEVLFDFGVHGVWVRRNDASWAQLHGLSPEGMVSADLDGSGKDDVAFDFGASGIWVRRNDVAWEKLHGLSPELMTSADVDHNALDELLLDFGPTYGVWIRRNDLFWQQLHPLSPEQIASGQLDSE